MGKLVSIHFQIEPQTWLKQITGTTRTGLILRDVSLEVGSSNIMAILGSKGITIGSNT